MAIPKNVEEAKIKISENYIYFPNQFGISVIENDELVKKIVPFIFLKEEI